MSEKDEGYESSIIKLVHKIGKDERHPVWRSMNLVVILSFVLLYSKLNASNFDRTEIIMWVQVALTAVGYEGFKAWLNKD